MTPTLSIIIPVYNKEQYIVRCLSSILEQSYSDFEIIVIDDGSKDFSGSLIEGIARYEKRIHYYKFENGGVAVARNRGIALAKGTYIMFIDADDWIDKGYLKNIMNKVEKSSADLYVWGITKDYEDGTHRVWLPYMCGYYSIIDFLRNFIQEQYESHRGLYGYISNKLLKRDIVEKWNIRFKETLKLMEDYDFFLTYYEYCKDVILFDEIGYHYVAGTEFSSRKLIKKIDFISIIDIHRKCLNLLKNKNALTNKNKNMLLNAIKNIAFAVFWEMTPVCRKEIKDALNNLLSRPEVLESFNNSNSRKEKLLAKMITQKNEWGLFWFIHCWRIYLKLRRL